MLDAFSALFVQILRLGQKERMVIQGLVALNVTKVKANASQRIAESTVLAKWLSHERMLKAKARLEKETQYLMREAEIVDAQEDGTTAKGRGKAISRKNACTGKIGW